jgi:tetrahydromethanopterin S-methyltransferase subunit G
MVTVSEEERLAQAVLRLNGVVLGLVFGIISGLLIFVATNWLVLKGGPTVGPHLALLGQFFIGYKVTFVGSFIGMAYGFVCGFVCGWILAWVYNFIVLFRR